MNFDGSRSSLQRIYATVKSGLSIMREEHEHVFSRLKISKYGILKKAHALYVPITGWYFIYGDGEPSFAFSLNLIKSIFTLVESEYDPLLYHMRQSFEFDPVITPLGNDIPFEAYYCVPFGGIDKTPTLAGW